MKTSQKRHHRKHSRNSGRRGATLVETALCLPVFLLLVFGMIDLGFAVQRRNLASEAARIGARQAIVHGSDAVQLGSWNTASAEAGIRTRLEPVMAAAAIDPADFHVRVTYQKNESGADDNAPGSTVVVRVTIDYEHLVPFAFFDPITVGSESSMIISN